MTRTLVCAVALSACGSACPGGGDVTIGFDDYPPGSLQSSYMERGVLVTPLGPAGLMSATVYPGEEVSVFDASADVDAFLRAELPEEASAVTVSFLATVNAVVIVNAFDEDGVEVDSDAEFGAAGAFDVVTVSVSAPGITRVEFGGTGEGESSTPRLVYTPATPACNAADLSPPRGVLDFSDALAFLGAFGSGGVDADLAEPFGILDFSDALAFITAFGAGCP